MDLAEFIDSHVKGLRRESAQPPHQASCLAVMKVAKTCVASRAGVAKGDRLSLVDGGPASRASPKLYEDRAKKRLLTFYSTARRELVELATTGIETGIELDYTAEGIRSRFKPEELDLPALERLWELGDCKSLLELSRACLRIKGHEQTPALLFEGVGLWEAGQYAQGLERIRAYATNHGNDWTMNFAAIAIHYVALEELRAGRKDAGLDRLKRGFEYYPLESTADAIAEITGVRPPLERPRWKGKRFPVAYSLPTLEGEKKTVGLGPTLQAMNDGQLLVVCVLVSYRSNGPYYDLLNRYYNFATWFAPFLAGLHVITIEPKRHPQRPYHYAREDELRGLGVPFELLLEDGEVAGALDPSGSPFVVVLDRQGAIVQEGGLESVDWWDALAESTRSVAR